MEASVIDLRYRMKEVLQALERREEIKVLYHGKVKGVIFPVGQSKHDIKPHRVQDHPLFGHWKTMKDTDSIIDESRQSRS